MVWNVGPVMAEYATHNIRHKTRARVQLYTIPDDRQSSTGTDEVVTPVHAKDAARNDGVADVVDRCAARVEEHGDRRDELRQKDDTNGLRPGEAYADHGAADSPVAHGQTDVERNVVPPAPSASVGRRGIEVFVRPCSA